MLLNYNQQALTVEEHPQSLASHVGDESKCDHDKEKGAYNHETHEYSDIKVSEQELNMGPNCEDAEHTKKSQKSKFLARPKLSSLKRILKPKFERSVSSLDVSTLDAFKTQFSQQAKELEYKPSPAPAPVETKQIKHSTEFHDQTYNNPIKKMPAKKRSAKIDKPPPPLY